MRGKYYFGQESSDVLSYKIQPDKQVKESENQSVSLINKKIHDENLEEDEEENGKVRMISHTKAAVKQLKTVIHGRSTAKIEMNERNYVLKRKMTKLKNEIELKREKN